MSADADLRWLPVGRPEEMEFTPGAAVRVPGGWVAIFPLDGGYVAIDNACPHAGAPLCDGTVLDGRVVCSLHLWEFDLRTGACDVGPDWNTRTWPVRLRDGVLELGVPHDGAPDSPPDLGQG